MSIITIEQLKARFEGGDFPGSTDYINLIDTLAALPEGGNVVLNGVGVPSSGTGANGDFYINTSNYDIYGPKTAGAWGSATSLVGTNGTNGATGPGVASGGTTGQYLTKVDGTNYNTQWSTLDVAELAQDAVGNNLSNLFTYNDSTGGISLDNAKVSDFLMDGASGNSYGLIGTSVYLDVKNTNGYNKEIELDIAAVKTQLNTDGYLTTSSTSTLTNKTLTSPKINEDVAVTATATELNYVDGVTSSIQTQLNGKQPLEDTGWTTLSSFSNSYSGSGSPAYRKINNVVYLRGRVSGGTANTTAFNLPSGYRPAVDTVFPVQQFGTGNINYITVLPDGNVVPNETAAWLSSVIFPVG